MNTDIAGTWIRLHDAMPEHEKIEGLSDKGFRLLVETWCWCSRRLNDGHVPEKIWSKRGTPTSRRELVAAELVEPLQDGSVQMHDYLDWQRSAAEAAEASEKKKTAGQKGAHARWHVANGKFEPTCEECRTAPKVVNLR